MKKQILTLILSLIAAFGMFAQDYNALSKLPAFKVTTDCPDYSEFGKLPVINAQSDCPDYNVLGNLPPIAVLVTCPDYSALALPKSFSWSHFFRTHLPQPAHVVYYPEKYKRLEVSYIHTMRLFPLNGMSIGGVYGLPLSKKLPFILETGLNLSINYRNGDYFCDYYNSTFNRIFNFNVEVPLNIMYKVFYNEDLSFNPFIGVNYRAGMVKANALSYGFEPITKWNFAQVGAQVGFYIKNKQRWYGLSYEYVPKLSDKFLFGKDTQMVKVTFGYSF